MFLLFLFLRPVFETVGAPTTQLNISVDYTVIRCTVSTTDYSKVFTFNTEEYNMECLDIGPNVDVLDGTEDPQDVKYMLKEVPGDTSSNLSFNIPLYEYETTYFNPFLIFNCESITSCNLRIDPSISVFDDMDQPIDSTVVIPREGFTGLHLCPVGSNVVSIKRLT